MTTKTTTGRIKIAGRFVHPANDFRAKISEWSIFQRGEVCVARCSNGAEGRCQLSDHGAGRKSFQVFDKSEKLIADFDTKEDYCDFETMRDAELWAHLGILRQCRKLSLQQLESLSKAIENAGSCDNSEDFIANLDDAIEYAMQTLAELQHLRRETKGAR